MYARYRTRSRFYKQPTQVLKAYNVNPNLLRKPKIKEGLLNGIYTDAKVDLREKDHLEMLESIRHPRERDFYQDHTYHNQWISRELEKHQKSQLAGRYAYFAPGYVMEPWVWYPGDVVEVTQGEGVGLRGTIIAVIKYKNEIVVQNVNVQDVTIPASETRPEQTVQREHPISVLRVAHIDPSTNQRCHVELVKLRNRETGALEEKRMVLESGVLMPIPPREDGVQVGDPLKDTALQDAEEETLDMEKEMPRMVERRLQAMENHFVESMAKSHRFHAELQQRNAQDMLHFQRAVVQRATQKLVERCGQSLLVGLVRPDAKAAATHANKLEYDNKNEKKDATGATLMSTPLPLWWESMLAPYMHDILYKREQEWSSSSSTSEEESDLYAAGGQDSHDESTRQAGEGDDDDLGESESTLVLDDDVEPPHRRS